MPTIRDTVRPGAAPLGPEVGAFQRIGRLASGQAKEKRESDQSDFQETD